MTFVKRKLAEAELGYAVGTLSLKGARRVIVASEGKGPALVFEGDELTPRVVSSQPGGSMGFAPVPGRDDAFFMITGFYPIFKAEAAGIDLVTEVDGFGMPWVNRRIVDLPFVHRITSVRTPAGDFLLGATVCGGKDFQEDWSKPGDVFAYAIPSSPDADWERTVILPSIHKNHGLTLGSVDGIQSLLIGGTEGLFALALPGSKNAHGAELEPWHVTKIIDHEVSEMGFYDFDGDGEDELAVIEPFHGNTISVYKRGRRGWKQVFSDALAFGHGLSVGTIDGRPVIVVGNRAGHMDLVCYVFGGDEAWEPERVVVDGGAASAGSTIIETPEGTGIVTSNPAANEYAIYLVDRSAS